MKVFSVLSVVSAIVCFAGMAKAQSTDVFDCNKPNAHYWMDGTMCLQKIIDKGGVGGGRASGDMGFCTCSSGGVYYKKVAQYIINESKYKGCKVFSASDEVSTKGGTFFSYGTYQCSGLD
ncbi:hypothetical protein BGW38_010086 [Lunasporangiospora selenospora]|uniref:Uncharacterized protein n=1 Tax=Lunasporangiospora selenospora TaxID=979761 RepID=A0A9P6FWT6_9FUNG|nr:hypothetical protein BGW38_010086 [Lunasporangiospora selenospora]